MPIVLIVSPRVLLLDLAGPLEALRLANRETLEVRFTVDYVGPSPTATSSIGLGLAAIGPLPGTLAPGTLLIVPGAADGGFGPDDALPEAQDHAIVEWLAATVRPGVRVASICSGALLAARAGLLDGHDCTTHHQTVGELTRVAPRARVLENRIFVESGERLTSAGVTAGIDLMLHVIAAEAGPAVALAVARGLVVYLRRSGSDPQLSPWLTGRNHIHPAIHRAQDAVAADPARDWSVPALAKVAATSSRNLSRLFNEQAGMSVTDYVNRIRVARAHELVTASRLGLEQIAERAGFGSARQLRRAWARIHALPPGASRRAGADRY